MDRRGPFGRMLSLPIFRWQFANRDVVIYIIVQNDRLSFKPTFVKHAQYIYAVKVLKLININIIL